MEKVFFEQGRESKEAFPGSLGGALRGGQMV